MDHSRNNQVALVGKVQEPLNYSHSLYGESFFSGAISVRRLSGAVDLLPITVSERLLCGIDLNSSEPVSILGQLRSYNKCIDGYNRLILTVFAHKMEAASEESRNEIVLSGFICKPPVYRTTPFHREIADILIAVNRAYNKSDYIPCITWGRSARFAQGLSVGCRVEADGRIQSREYQKTLENGTTVNRTAYEVSISTLRAAEDDFI